MYALLLFLTVFPAQSASFEAVRIESKTAMFDPTNSASSDSWNGRLCLEDSFPAEYTGKLVITLKLLDASGTSTISDFFADIQVCPRGGREGCPGDTASHIFEYPVGDLRGRDVVICAYGMYTDKVILQSDQHLDVDEKGLSASASWSSYSATIICARLPYHIPDGRGLTTIVSATDSGGTPIIVPRLAFCMPSAEPVTTVENCAKQWQTSSYSMVTLNNFEVMGCANMFTGWATSIHVTLQIKPAKSGLAS